MKNLLRLHEAIAVVLLSNSDRIASLKEISQEIARRGLYFQKTGCIAPPDQIRLRTHPNTTSGKQYSHMFRYIEPDKVQLK
jgi:pyoverdine/dityrosine biosynthesis protein Dit1